MPCPRSRVNQKSTALKRPSAVKETSMCFRSLLAGGLPKSKCHTSCGRLSGLYMPGASCAPAHTGCMRRVVQGGNMCNLGPVLYSLWGEGCETECMPDLLRLAERPVHACRQLRTGSSWLTSDMHSTRARAA